MSEVKFCVHISGSDDVIPVHDMAEAVRAAAFLNAEYLMFHMSLKQDGLTPYCFASPALWPGPAFTHAEALKEAKESVDEKAPHWMCA